MTKPQASASEAIQAAINFLAIFLAVAVFVWAFRDEFKSKPEPEEPSQTKKEADEEEPSDKFVFGNIGNKIRKENHFTYPDKLEDVEKLAQDAGGWLPNPIVSGYDLLFDFYTPTPEPKKSIEEVRKLQNTSPEINAEIIDAFQRIPDRRGMDPAQDSPGVDYNAELHYHVPANVGSLNPLLYSSQVEAEALDYTQISLFAYNKKTLKYLGNSDVIRSWESSADHLMDKFVIRDDLLWSDGQPVTAYDWEFTYNAIMTSAIPVKALRSGTDLLNGVKAYNKNTLIFFHQNPLPITAENMSFPIIPKHIYEKTVADDPSLTSSPEHQKQEHDPVTCGAYTVEKFHSNNLLVFRRRESFYMYKGKAVREKPTLNRVHFLISPEYATAFMQLRNGDIDVMDLPPELWETQAATPEFYQENTKASATRWSYMAFWFNMQKDCPFFQDIRVRQALSMAFDYDEMLKVHRKNLAIQCRGMFTESSLYFPHYANLPFIRQDIEKARQLLTEAGWVDSDHDGLLDHEWNGKRIPFSFTMITSNKPDRVDLCRLFAKCLSQIGIECIVQPMEFNVQYKRCQDHKFHMTFGGWVSGADPHFAIDVWATGANRNYISYSNKKVDELFDAGKKEFDRAKRIAIYQKIHELIFNDYPCIWLYTDNTNTAFNKNLRGIGFYFRGAILDGIWREEKAY